MLVLGEVEWWEAEGMRMLRLEEGGEVGLREGRVRLGEEVREELGLRGALRGGGE